ncbi:hypothetical protein CYMTET_25134 [Cymbomonas tetramitiformis]|uniref:Uncharacterized protein n=1 Tax=Cymbomonas tetramitiformis TaxID=36881 RepID=A0AAE0FUB3_9CHLO|nr:hypothetical protein CYMTET_25134 [Cymbomonas tetramitiformis]
MLRYNSAPVGSLPSTTDFWDGISKSLFPPSESSTPSQSRRSSMEQIRACQNTSSTPTDAEWGQEDEMNLRLAEMLKKMEGTRRE